MPFGLQQVLIKAISFLSITDNRRFFIKYLYERFRFHPKMGIDPFNFIKKDISQNVLNKLSGNTFFHWLFIFFFVDMFQIDGHKDFFRPSPLG